MEIVLTELGHMMRLSNLRKTFAPYTNWLQLAAENNIFSGCTLPGERGNIDPSNMPPDDNNNCRAAAIAGARVAQLREYHLRKLNANANKVNKSRFIVPRASEQRTLFIPGHYTEF